MRKHWIATRLLCVRHKVIHYDEDIEGQNIKRQNADYNDTEDEDIWDNDITAKSERQVVGDHKEQKLDDTMLSFLETVRD